MKYNNDMKRDLSLDYPCYINNQPIGEDYFEGKSQEKVASSIATHILETDNRKESYFPRLIGIEGKWGSGKSNVLKIVENKLKNDYIFFTFDAWCNQEDLQRRSLLELLTEFLITHDELKGKTKKFYFSSDTENIVEKECSWREKLESLLSRKTYSRTITIPKLICATKLFILTLLLTGLIVSFLSVDKFSCWWGNVIVAFVPFVIFCIYMFLSKSSWEEMFSMYQTDNRTDTKSYVVSEQEPSIREFKSWMNEVSSGLENNRKLVIILDNMDRLTSEKVKKFWSLIQTFFSDSKYSNIWCVVPFDEMHLSLAFDNSSPSEDGADLLRLYLNKTFPLIFRVPEPIISDYKLVFDKLYEKAFGNTESDEIIELIGKCYRKIHPSPNIREIIMFLNENVSLKKQWDNVIHPVSRALFILRSSEIANVKSNKLVSSDKSFHSVEEYLLGDEYLSNLENILIGNIDLPTVQREICALVYGVDVNKAFELVVKKYISDCIQHPNNENSINVYVKSSNFYILYEEVVNSLDHSDYESAVYLTEKLDEIEFNELSKKSISRIWHFFAVKYISLKNSANSYSSYERALFSHLDHDDLTECIEKFCKLFIENKDITGDIVYLELTRLFNENFTKDFVLKNEFSIDAQRFIDYVEAAKDNYKHYPIKTNCSSLNDVLLQKIKSLEPFSYTLSLSLLKNDPVYSFEPLIEQSVNITSSVSIPTQIVVNYISVQRIFFDKFQSKLTPLFINKLWDEVNKSGIKSQCYEEIYALKATSFSESLPSDDKHVEFLVNRAMFYVPISDLFCSFFKNPNLNHLKAFVKKIIVDKVCVGPLNESEFISHMYFLSQSLSVDKKDIITFAECCGIKKISGKCSKSSFFSLFPDISWIDSLLSSETSLSNELLQKCTNELVNADVGKLLNENNATHPVNNYTEALRKLIDTNFLHSENLNNLNTVSVKLLDYIARVGEIKDTIWLGLLLKTNYSNISSEFVEIRNKILNSVDSYTMTPNKFKQLHVWLEQSGINDPDHICDAANQILAKVVSDPECQIILCNHKEYYEPIICKSIEKASALHAFLKSLVESNDESEFKKYILSLNLYELKDDAL